MLQNEPPADATADKAPEVGTVSRRHSVTGTHPSCTSRSIKSTVPGRSSSQLPGPVLDRLSIRSCQNSHCEGVCVLHCRCLAHLHRRHHSLQHPPLGEHRRPSSLTVSTVACSSTRQRNSGNQHKALSAHPNEQQSKRDMICCCAKGRCPIWWGLSGSVASEPLYLTEE